MDNNAILSAGRQIYAKKRKQRQEQLPEINFDPKARREFLTGFHKRKVARREKAQEVAKQREKQEKLEARRITREARKEEAARKVQEMKKIYGEGSDQESDGQDATGWVPAIEEAKFESPEHLTTVTIMEDFDPDRDRHQIETETLRPLSESSHVAIARQEKVIKTKSIPLVKRKKFRYETKAARKASMDKAKRGKARSRDERKTSSKRR